MNKVHFHTAHTNLIRIYDYHSHNGGCKIPVKNKRGYSPATVDKESGLQKILAQHVNVVKRILLKHKWAPQRYYYIDAYCGPGENPEVGAAGSPLVFLEVAKDIEIPFNAWFIDIEQNNTMLLKARLGESENFEVLTGDNRMIVPRIADEKIPKYAYGLIYADATNIPDFELLGNLSRLPKLRYFDILIRYSASMVKRTRHLTGMEMRDYLKQIDKKYWTIRDILPGDRWQWTFLLGMNWSDMRDWTSQRFYKISSQKGKEIFDHCNNMRKQRTFDGTM